VISRLAPRLPKRVGDRELVFTAAVGGAIVELYVDEPGFDDAALWASLGARIAITMTPITRPSGKRETQVDLPEGWRLVVRDDAATLTTALPGKASCEIREPEVDPVRLAPESSVMVAGRLRGGDLYWSEWEDAKGHHAETMRGAARVGTIHVHCVARRHVDLDELVRVVEQRVLP
jgi:hypothetical protein